MHLSLAFSYTEQLIVLVVLVLSMFGYLNPVVLKADNKYFAFMPKCVLREVENNNSFIHVCYCIQM